MTSERLAALAITVILILALGQLGLGIDDPIWWGMIILFEINWYLAQRIVRQELAVELAEQIEKMKREQNDKEKEV